MRTKLLALLGGAALLIFSSCKSLRPAFNKKSSNGSASMIRGKMFEGGSLFTSFYDATKRSTLTFITPQGQPRILAENNPDAGMNRAFDLLASLNLKTPADSLTASTKLSIANTIVKLTDKSPTNIYIRDALYRLNEMYINTLCLDCEEPLEESKDEITSRLNEKKFLIDKVCSDCKETKNKAQALTRQDYFDLFKQILTTSEKISESESKTIEALIKKQELEKKINDLTEELKKEKDNSKKIGEIQAEIKSLKEQLSKDQAAKPKS